MPILSIRRYHSTLIYYAELLRRILVLDFMLLILSTYLYDAHILDEIIIAISSANCF